MTAARLGAHTLNYTEVRELLHKTEEDGRKVVCGARVYDKTTSEFIFLSQSVLDVHKSLDTRVLLFRANSYGEIVRYLYIKL